MLIGTYMCIYIYIYKYLLLFFMMFSAFVLGTPWQILPQGQWSQRSPSQPPFPALCSAVDMQEERDIIWRDRDSLEGS